VEIILADMEDTGGLLNGKKESAEFVHNKNKHIESHTCIVLS
jgi:hypothetical protein